NRPVAFRDLLSFPTRRSSDLDYVWTRLDADPRFRAGIFDSVAVHHTRPVGGSLRRAMLEKGRTPESEEALLRSRYGIADRPAPRSEEHTSELQSRENLVCRLL